MGAYDTPRLRLAAQQSASSAIKQASGADYAQWTGAAPLHEISGISSSAIPSLKSTNSTRRRNSITGRGKRRGYAPENSSP